MALTTSEQQKAGLLWCVHCSNPDCSSKLAQNEVSACLNSEANLRRAGRKEGGKENPMSKTREELEDSGRKEKLIYIG